MDEQIPLPASFKELDVVKVNNNPGNLTLDNRDNLIPPGTIGTVVHVTVPGKVYLVEFTDASGVTVGVCEAFHWDLDPVTVW